MREYMHFFKTRTPQNKDDLDNTSHSITTSTRGTPQPDLARKFTRVLGLATAPHVATTHFVRARRCACLGRLLLEGGTDGYSASQLWEYWLSLDIIAVKQMRKGERGQSCNGPRSSRCRRRP